MASEQLDIVAFEFILNDGAAAPSTPVALVPPGLTDAVDVADIVMPYAGYIVGISVQSPVSSGDTVQVQATINGTVQAGMSATNSNAAPNAFVTPAAGSQIAFAAGQRIGAKYLTTTGGTYTAHDIECVVYVGLPFNPQMLAV